MEFNEYQTQLTGDILKNISKEEKSLLYDYIDNIKFIQRLVQPNRKRARDLERDEFGRIIVDITDPHILEDMDYFRQPAIHYQKTGKYTDLHPNSHPQSEYARFWAQEAERCREGYVRESNGEWIPGLFYFYLNYSPILLSKKHPKLKKQVKVREFPHVFDSDYQYFHYIEQASNAGRHCNVLKSRGKGYSYKGASINAKFFILGDRQEPETSQKEQTVFNLANEKEYLTKDGILNKFITNIDWCADHTPFPRHRLKSSMNDMVWTMGYINKDTGRQDGTLNSVQGVSLKNDPDKARGKRGAVILWEEMGKFPGLLKAWNVARPSVEDGNEAFGIMIAFGTGGADEADFDAAEEMFYHPDGYNILELPNVYDKGTGENSKCAFFVPEYMNRKGCYDKNGNSDVIKALLEVVRNRIRIKYGSSDPNALTQEKAERPITPQEAILRKEGNLFPAEDLKDYLADILVSEDQFVSAHYTGRLGIDDDGDVNWKISPDMRPIREYPLKDQLNKAGAIEIFRMPIKSFDGSIPYLRYIGGIDTYDDDQSTTTSLGSIFIFDRFTDQIVAEYTGRPRTANEFYEICLRLGKFYNALLLYENDKKGLFPYFSNRNALTMLADTPQILKDMEIIKAERLYGNKSKGVNGTTAVNAFGRQLQAHWMLDKAVTTMPEEQIEADEEVKIQKLNLQTIRSLGYIREAISWNPDGNFDRVSAMNMVMILREELAKHDVKKLEKRMKSIADDPYFTRHKITHSNKSYTQANNELKNLYFN